MNVNTVSSEWFSVNWLREKKLFRYILSQILSIYVVGRYCRLKSLLNFKFPRDPHILNSWSRVFIKYVRFFAKLIISLVLKAGKMRLSILQMIVFLVAALRFYQMFISRLSKIDIFVWKFDRKCKNEPKFLSYCSSFLNEKYML